MVCREDFLLRIASERMEVTRLPAHLCTWKYLMEEYPTKPILPLISKIINWTEAHGLNIKLVQKLGSWICYYNQYWQTIWHYHVWYAILTMQQLLVILFASLNTLSFKDIQFITGHVCRAKHDMAGSKWQLVCSLRNAKGSIAQERRCSSLHELITWFKSLRNDLTFAGRIRWVSGFLAKVVSVFKVAVLPWISRLVGFVSIARSDDMHVFMFLPGFAQLLCLEEF